MSVLIDLSYGVVDDVENAVEFFVFVVVDKGEAGVGAVKKGGVHGALE